MNERHLERLLVMMYMNDYRLWKQASLEYNERKYSNRKKNVITEIRRANMSEEIDENIIEAVHDELKDIVKKLLIESVDIEVIYKVFSKLSKEEIDEIELDASVIRQKNFNREFWKQYYEEHKDNPDDIMVQIHNDAVKDAKIEYEIMIIKNLKEDNVPVEKIQSIFPQYTPEQMDGLVREYDKEQKEKFIIEMMTDYSEKHPDEDNAISKLLTYFDVKYWRDAQIILIKNMKMHTPVFELAEYFDDFTEDEIEKM